MYQPKSVLSVDASVEGCQMWACGLNEAQTHGLRSLMLQRPLLCHLQVGARCCTLLAGPLTSASRTSTRHKHRWGITGGGTPRCLEGRRHGMSSSQSRPVFLQCIPRDARQGSPLDMQLDLPWAHACAGGWAAPGPPSGTHGWAGKGACRPAACGLHRPCCQLLVR